MIARIMWLAPGLKVTSVDLGGSFFCVPERIQRIDGHKIRMLGRLNPTDADDDVNPRVQ